MHLGTYLLKRLYHRSTWSIQEILEQIGKPSLLRLVPPHSIPVFLTTGSIRGNLKEFTHCLYPVMSLQRSPMRRTSIHLLGRNPWNALEVLTQIELQACSSTSYLLWVEATLTRRSWIPRQSLKPLNLLAGCDPPGSRHSHSDLKNRGSVDCSIRIRSDT